MTPATRAWEEIKAYCGCGRILANPSSQPHQVPETVTCGCGQANVAQFWRQQPPTQCTHPWHSSDWHTTEYAHNQPAEFHKLP